MTMRERVEGSRASPALARSEVRCAHLVGLGL
jgi:hypothetical protein